jgi:hypothetical protein
VDWGSHHESATRRVGVRCCPSARRTRCTSCCQGYATLLTEGGCAFFRLRGEKLAEPSIRYSTSFHLPCGTRKVEPSSITPSSLSHQQIPPCGLLRDSAAWMGNRKALNWRETDPRMGRSSGDIGAGIKESLAGQDVSEPLCHFRLSGCRPRQSTDGST